jgi:hypothetical protein
MTDWAILDERGVVTQIVTAQDRPAGSISAPPGTVVGHQWTGWLFEGQRWSSLQFLLRFTDLERGTIYASSDPVVRDWLQLAASAQEVFADDPNTVLGLDYLRSIGLLSSQRVAELRGYA